MKRAGELDGKWDGVPEVPAEATHLGGGALVAPECHWARGVRRNVTRVRYLVKSERALFKQKPHKFQLLC